MSDLKEKEYFEFSCKFLSGEQNNDDYDEFTEFFEKETNKTQKSIKKCCEQHKEKDNILKNVTKLLTIISCILFVLNQERHVKDELEDLLKKIEFILYEKRVHMRKMEYQFTEKFRNDDIEFDKSKVSSIKDVILLNKK